MKVFAGIILSFLFIHLPTLSFSQANDEAIDALEKTVDDLYGIDKLKALNSLSGHFIYKESRKGMRYGKRAVYLAKDIFNDSNALVDSVHFYLKGMAYCNLGRAHFFREQYFDAQKNLRIGEEASQQAGYQAGVDTARLYLTRIDTLFEGDSTLSQGYFKKAWKSFEINRNVSKAKQDMVLTRLLKSAVEAEEKEDLLKAISIYEKAINILKDKGDAARIAELHQQIATLHHQEGNYKEAVSFFQLSMAEKEKMGDSAGLIQSVEKVKLLYDDIAALEKESRPAILNDEEEEKAIEEKDRFKELAEDFEEQQDYKKSLEYYKKYAELNATLQEVARRKEKELLEKSFEIENKGNQITLLKQQKEIQELDLQKKATELEKQEGYRNSLIIGVTLLLILAVTLYLLFLNRRKSHKRLTIAYDKLKEVKDQLFDAQDRIKQLLGQQVSKQVAQTLLMQDQEEAIKKTFVCVMFLDIRGFTPFAEKRTPEKIIQYQNDVFGFMIEIIDRRKGFINQFLGDGFMATFGVPSSQGNDCENAYQAAVEIVKTVNEKSKSGEIPKTRVGIGLHAGYVVAGNVGTDTRKQFSITGNPVITAARIEQLNKTYSSQLLISEEVFNQLDSKPKKDENDFIQVEVKGRNESVSLVRIA